MTITLTTTADPVLARMRAAHLKATADAALAAGNAGEAARGYEDAAAALPPGAPPPGRGRLAALGRTAPIERPPAPDCGGPFSGVARARGAVHRLGDAVGVDVRVVDQLIADAESDGLVVEEV
jgi:hypothetical protein